MIELAIKLIALSGSKLASDRVLRYCFGSMLVVLFENDEILIIDKPCGLPVQGGAGVSTSILEVVERDFRFKPYLVHRLDRETAGCLAIARSPRTAARYGDLLSARDCDKRYRAIVFGNPLEDRFDIEEDILVRGERKGAKTSARVIERYDGFSLLELKLGTGRNHQIRIHLAAAGFPIVADDRHGDFRRNKAAAKTYGAKKLMLYSCELSFGSGVRAEAPPPPHFTVFLDLLRDRGVTGGVPGAEP